MGAWDERCGLLIAVVYAVASSVYASRTCLLQQEHLRPRHQQGQQQLRQRQLVELRGGAGGSVGKRSGQGSEGLEIDVGSSSPGIGAAMADPSARVLILDVDGTVYGRRSGVEKQIVDGIHRYFGRELGLTPAECDDIHRGHGSTVWGLQLEERLEEDQIKRYYKEVFASVSLDGLHADGGGGVGDATGYQHRANAAQMIRAHRGPIFIASNSPSSHVRRVLEGVGLGDARFAGFLTPDTREWLTKSSPEFYDPILEHDSVRDAGLARGDVWLLDDSAVNLKVASRLGFRTLLVDGDGDGDGGTDAAGAGALPLERALACFVGAIPHPEEWKFSDSKYLRSKNAVDEVSRSKDVWKRLEDEVLALGLGGQDTLRVADLGCGLLPLLGEFRSLAKACGVRRLEYCGLEKEEGIAKQALEDLLCEGYTLHGGHRGGDGDAESSSSSGGGGAPSWQLSMGGNETSGLPETALRIIPADFTSVDPATLFSFSSPSFSSKIAAREGTPRRPHVLVGCCLADLLEPNALIRALKRLAGVGVGGGGGGGSCLVYLPITFAGKTSMIPSAPQEGLIPSDESVLGAYDTCLREQQGHYTCLKTLLQTIREHGGEVMASSPSPWRVSFCGSDRYMWQCLLYFIGLGLAPHPLLLDPPPPAAAAAAATSGEAAAASKGEKQQQQLGAGGAADFPGWVRRARERTPVLQADNVDLLFGLRGGGSSGGDAGRGGECLPEDGDCGGGGDGGAGRWWPRQQQSPRGGGVKGSPPAQGEEKKAAATDPGGDGDGRGGKVRDNAFLEFVAPGEVRVRHEELDEEAAVGEGQVLVQAICSSISSGTELKVFRGDFDSDTELDTTIKGMAGENMAYPLRYGYSLVGRVVKCGNGVDPEKFIGKLVFSFSAHSSWVVADADGVKLVPEGIEPDDAVYFPAVETALSLVHDVNPRVGESVAVFGQGMIGLLSVSILAKGHGGVAGGSVVAVDMLPNRLKVAERLGAKAAVTPADAAGLAPFDISLEVTGNPGGLQSALDLTGYGGRVVLGSWYGGGAARLNLGMSFHRSHLTIQTSQVSRLPAGLTDRWDKKRRFAAAWSLVRELRPSSFLTTSSPGLEGAQGAYEALGSGKELGVVFRY